MFEDTRARSVKRGGELMLLVPLMSVWRVVCAKRFWFAWKCIRRWYEPSTAQFRSERCAAHPRDRRTTTRSQHIRANTVTHIIRAWLACTYISRGNVSHFECRRSSKPLHEPTIRTVFKTVLVREVGQLSAGLVQHTALINQSPPRPQSSTSPATVYKYLWIAHCVLNVIEITIDFVRVQCVYLQMSFVAHTHTQITI